MHNEKRSTMGRVVFPRRRVAGAALIAAALLLAAPVGAQQGGGSDRGEEETPRPSAPAPESPAPGPRVTIAAKEADVRAVLERLFADAKIENYSIANDVTGRVTLSLKDRSFEEALSLLARVARPPLAWRKIDGIYEVRVRPARRAEAADEDMPAREQAVEIGGGRRVEVIKLMYADARDIVAVLSGLRPDHLTGAYAYVPLNRLITRWGAVGR
jgi:type II secretory pathway component HofQ